MRSQIVRQLLGFWALNDVQQQPLQFGHENAARISAVSRTHFDM